MFLSCDESDKLSRFYSTDSKNDNITCLKNEILEENKNIDISKNKDLSI